MRVDLNLPWSCEKGAVEIIDADGGTAAYALSSSETPHIVKAVNNHDALVSFISQVAEISMQPYLKLQAENILHNIGYNR